MLRFHRTFLLALLSFLPLGTAVATASPPGSTPPALISIVTETGDTISALGIEPSGIGSVRIVDAQGRYEFISANHIRRVLDERGEDRTRAALDQRRVVGWMPAALERRETRNEPHPVRYGPRSVTSNFRVTETSLLGRVDRSSRDERAFTASFDIGEMFNVTDHDAVGASFFVGGGDGSGDVGIRARYRRWLGRRSCIDLAPGVILAHEEPGAAHGVGVGLVGHASCTCARWVSVALQVYSVKRSDAYPAYGIEPLGYAPNVEPGYRDTGVMLGFKLGGKAGIAAAATGSLVAFALAGNRGHDLYKPLGLP